MHPVQNLVCTSSQLSRVGMGTCAPKTLLDVSGGVTVRAGIPQTVNRGDVGVSFGSNSHGIFLDDNTPTFPFPLSVSSLTSADRNFVESSRRSVVDLENIAFRASSSNAAAGLTESSPSSPARSSLSDSDKNEMHSLNTENLFSMNVLVNGVRRAQFYGTSSLPNSLFGPLDVRGQTIRLGTTLPRLALADNGAGLLQVFTLLFYSLSFLPHMQYSAEDVICFCMSFDFCASCLYLDSIVDEIFLFFFPISFLLVLSWDRLF